MSTSSTVVVVTTDQAAEAIGVEPTSFPTWAPRRGLQPLRTIRVGKSTLALYDLDAVYAVAGRSHPA